jgi:hypothetical protein
MFARPSETELAPEFYQAIGRVATEWALLEFLIDEAIWRLAGLSQETGACITSHLQSANRRMQALIALVRLRGGLPSHITSLNKTSSRMDELARMRNRFIHDTWSHREETGAHYRLNITAERMLDLAYKPVTQEELAQFVTDVLAARTVFLAVMQSAYFVLGIDPEHVPSLPRPPEPSPSSPATSPKWGSEGQPKNPSKRQRPPRSSRA